MLPKKNKIDRHLFSSLKRGVFSKETPFFSVRVYDISQLEGKGAVVVSSKVHKSAVERNRIRRRIYSFLQKRLKEKRAVILYVKKSAIDASGEEIKKALSSI